MKYDRTKARRIAFVGLFSSLALLLSYVEFLLPPIFAAVPGIKIGLPNVVILYVLYSLGFKYAALVSFVRVSLSSLLFGSVMTLAYSVAGAVLSLTVMVVLKHIDKLSAVGVSVAGGIMHNIGQIAVAVILLDTPEIAYYMLVLALTGTVSGIFVGLCGALVLRRVPVEKIFKIR